jgi:hypothetical protein
MAYTSLCKKMLALHENVLAVYVIEKDMITEWMAKPNTTLPSADRMQTIVAQRALIFALAKAQDDFLGKICHIMIRYDDSDLYYFSLNSDKIETSDGDTDIVPVFDKDILVVRIKQPYPSETFANTVLKHLAA